MNPIRIPDAIRDLGDVVFVVNVSGGKDSTALVLAMREAEIPHRRVFADTRWEAPETYAHLDHLRTVLGPIDVVGYPGGMPAKIREGARFASRMQRWCTRELKIEPLRAYFDTLETGDALAVCCTGIRAEEGTERNGRATMPEVEDDERWGGWMWRPILAWTIADVLAIHHRHGVPVNPLYQRGHDRVGCYPCVMANKEDVRLVAEHAPERIAEIRELEQTVTAERERRNIETPGRYTYPNASFFLKAMARSDPAGATMTIDQVVTWARTDRGGASASHVPARARWRLLSVGPLRSAREADGVATAPPARTLAASAARRRAAPRGSFRGPCSAPRATSWRPLAGRVSRSPRGTCIRCVRAAWWACCCPASRPPCCGRSTRPSTRARELRPPEDSQVQHRARGPET